MIPLKDQRLLVIAPHPDDEVFGCGGLIARCKREGGEVFVLFLTVGETKDFSKREGSTVACRTSELTKAAAKQRFDGYRIALPGNDHHLRLDSIPQGELIHEIERGDGISLEETKPTIVVAPHVHDYNQDHRAAARATITAMRPTASPYKHAPDVLLHYELPPAEWTIPGEDLERNFFVSLEEEDLDAACAALKLYESQLKHPDAALSLNGFRTLAAMRGMQCGEKYAEAFVMRRMIL